MRFSLILVCVSLLSTTLLRADEAAVFSPPDSLTIQGIPAVPQALVEKARRYTDFRTASLYSWHPKKREMLIGTRFADSIQVHQVAMPGGARRQMTFRADHVTAASYHPSQADYFIFTTDLGGDEFFQFYRYDLASGDSTLITDGKSRNTMPVWSRKGDRIAYGSTRRNRADVDFYVVDPANPQSDKLLSENKGGGWTVVDWSPDGKQLLASEFFSANEGYIWLVDTTTGAKTLLTPKTEGVNISYRPVGFSSDSKGLYVITDRDSEFLRLAYVDLATKEHKYLTTDIKWDVDHAKLSDNGDRLAFVTNENGISLLHMLDTTSGKHVDVTPQGSIGVITEIEWRPGSSELGFVVTSAHSPADVYSMDLSTSKIDRWTESETGGLDASKFIEPKLVTWKSFDGREISGFLYQPQAEKFPGKRPVIVQIHGGPESQSRPIYLARNNFYLNELGVALLFPNVRGSSGYGKSFLALDNGYKREDTYKDIGALFDWIATQPNLDSSRVMVTGGSYGGHMTLAIATLYNDRIRCSLDVVGISNFVTFLERTEAYRRDLRRVEYGDERDPKMREFLENIAPLRHADAIKRPLFVVQGKNDPRVPLNESDQIVTTVGKQGTPVWYLVAADEGHGFQKKKNADYQFYATIMYVEKFLLGE